MSDAVLPRKQGVSTLKGAADMDAEVLGNRTTIYVYEAPVRFWHWLNALCVMVLAVTGYLIGSPLATQPGEASDHFLMGYIRFTHFSAGQILAVGFLMRLLWAVIGNSHARQIFYIPFWDMKWWGGVIQEARWYAFIDKEPRKYVGHNPLAQIAMFLMFTVLLVFMMCTGFALYSEGAGRDSWWYKAFGWVFDIFPNSQDVHTWHHMGMWVLVVFATIHIYAAIREDILSRQTLISTMVSGERQFRDDRED